MSPWHRGADEIDELIASRQIERRPGADHGTQALMARADQLLVSVRTLLDTDPATA